jgi:hypothetical protein
MLRKMIQNKQELWVVLRFAQIFVNVLQLYGGKMCTQLWGNQQSVHFRCLNNVSNF